MIKEKGKGSSSGKMGGSMMDNGKMESRMEEVNLSIKINKKESENGIKEEKSDG